MSDLRDRWAQREAMIARMSLRELDAYSSGLSNAYSDVFGAFATAFASGQDIHWLIGRISAQWDELRETQIVRGVL